MADWGCESDRSFLAISAGHGGGRDLKGIADFANGRRCAKNFGNAMDSSLTAGGAYVTGETKTSFKGYYRVLAKQDAALIRSFVQFDGEGETANARQRESSGRIVEECLSSKRSAQSVRKRRRLRSVRNASGLRWRPQQEIRAPEFWPNETLGPILAQYKKDHPAPAQEPTPICKGR
jgi:hypothetical protein